jgi:hypothetical protein
MIQGDVSAVIVTSPSKSQNPKEKRILHKKMKYGSAFLQSEGGHGIIFVQS